MLLRDAYTKQLFFTLTFFCLSIEILSQRAKADSLGRLLETENIDSNRVNLLWHMADIMNVYDPQSGLKHAREALDISRKINYTEGISRSLGIIANAYFKIGNYPPSLEYNLQKLKIEEKRENHRSLASVLMNIGLVHNLQEEYRKALEYFYKADSVIRTYDVQSLKPHIALNIGDTYDKLNALDSAFLFYNTSLKEAKKNENADLVGAALVGLGHIYRKQSNFILSKESYQDAVTYLSLANDDDLLCEAELGLAQLYNTFQQADSAIFHAGISFRIAVSGKFESRQLDAARLLYGVFSNNKKTDSAYAYLNLVQQLNDTINNKNRIRESQKLVSNEQLRQLEIAENKRKAQKERSQQLQMLFIGIFIPGFFLLTLLLSRVKLHVRLIRLLGVLSLLIFFEYLTLMLHPTISELTHHTPIFEILIFVCLAAVLIPLHHRTEHWLIHKLIHHRINNPDPEKNTVETKKTSK